MMIPIDTYRTIVDQTDDLDELLQLKENIRKQKYEVMKQFDRLHREIRETMTLALPDISSLLQSDNVGKLAKTVEEWGKQDGAKKLIATQNDFNKNILAYDELIKHVSKKCSNLIWKKHD